MSGYSTDPFIVTANIEPWQFPKITMGDIWVLDFKTGERRNSRTNETHVWRDFNWYDKATGALVE